MNAIREHYSNTPKLDNQDRRVNSYLGIRKVAEADFPTRWGRFRILGFEGRLGEDLQIERLIRFVAAKDLSNTRGPVPDATPIRVNPRNQKDQQN